MATTAARVPVAKTYKIYIGGQFPRTESGRYYPLQDRDERVIANVCRASRKDFRNAVVNFVLRARAKNNGQNPAWNSYEKLREVIEKKMFANTEELLPVISFNPKSSKEEQKKHDDFVDRMVRRGYTEKQVRLLCEWYLRVRKSQ